ncbi:TCP-1/cpn60 chaperonin family protein [Natronorubrum tibetense]|uniref:Thermosome n=1 Tax=Natronorubrum tibetense GA33 TaxID=1114856 RepID=L9VKR2_9EURY|nr:TCP-1/cpn60 chaperonin family protein [Natronorubrum tibetense]ELY37795.1 thermosome [Natronorubrum tibetense GA33]
MPIERSPTTKSLLSEAAVHDNFRTAARSFVDLTETMLGPQGMYKLVIPEEGESIVTRDCSRVLRTIEVDHPVGRLLYGVGNTQSSHYDDGVVTSVLLTARLLTDCLETTIETGIHPQIVRNGLEQARAIAVQTLEDAAFPIEPDPTDSHMRALAQSQARTKLIDGAAFGPLITEVLTALARDARPTEAGGLLLDTDRAHVIARTGSSRAQTQRFDGILVQKELLNRDRTSIRDARVATVDQKFYIETTRGEAETQRRAAPSSPEQLNAFHRAEDAVHDRFVRPLREAGVDVLVTRKGIDERVSTALLREGILTVRRAKPENILESVAAATGASVVGDVQDISPTDIGYAGQVEELTFGPLSYTLIGECESTAATTVLTRGGTWTSAEEIERGLEAAIGATAAAVREPATVPGGGCSEMHIARSLRWAGAETAGREAIILETIADTFETVVRTLATNVGLDDLDAVTTVRARVPEEAAGVVDPSDGPARVDSVVDAGVIDSLAVKRAAVTAAFDATIHAITIDEIVAVK